ncbi:MAG TPA: dihydrolipoamide acetyltransferase family protein [Patescibacteria group bacterium]|nr:dihydrolipoamide acetyltransferase family protein [Patescibacteria group bacterium]
MAVDVVMPQMGESIFEGTITKWLKKAGEKVDRDEPLFEISTDKVDAEIPSPVSGTLQEIKVNEGQTVPIKTVVALIDADGAGAAAAATPAAGAAKPAPAAAPPPVAPPPAAVAPPPPAAEPAEEEQGRIRSSPLVRKMAGEQNIDLSQVKGTGAGGRISKQDIEAYLASGRPAQAAAAGTLAPPPPPPPAPGAAAPAVTLEVGVPRERLYFGRYEVEPLSVMRQRIAEHMVMSKRVSAHVYSVDEADITKIADTRKRLKGQFEAETGTKLTFMPFFIRAAVEALRAFPTVNASLDGTNLVLHHDINIGIAVALDWGLIVPVVKGADEKNFLGLQRAINDLAERARAKRLKPEEVQEGTFSITNPGVFGGLFGLPVINQPNVGILGLGAVQKRAVVINDAIAIRSMVYLTLSYDHRVVDGVTAHQFLQKIKSSLENWTEPVL